MRNDIRAAGRCLAVGSLMWAALGHVVPAMAVSPGAFHVRFDRPVHHRVSPRALQTTNSIRIYLVALGDQGKTGIRIGCGDSLIAVRTPVTPTNAPLRVALRLLLASHSRYYGQSGLYNALYQSRLTVAGLQIKNGRAAISLVGMFRLGGVCDSPRLKAQLRRTALQFPTVHSVTILINGVALRKLLSGKGG